MNKQLPTRGCSAKVLLWVPAALCFRRIVGIVGISLSRSFQAPITKWFSFWKVVAILLWFVAEMLLGEVAFCLVPPIDDGNVGLDASLQDLQD
jgi:hypothetical protein